MEQTALEPAPRPMSPLARWAFHPDRVQCGLGVLFCGTVLAALPLVPGHLLGLLFAVWVLVPLLLLHTRDHQRVGATALVGVVGAWLGTALALLAV
jgi:hypothetical protein